MGMVGELLDKGVCSLGIVWVRDINWELLIGRWWEKNRGY